jgi:hypothetical protein
LSVHLHRAIEEQSQVVFGEIDNAALRLTKITDQANIDRLELVALAHRLGVQILGKGLPRLDVFR